MKKRETSGICNPTTLTPALNYVWIDPPKTTKVQGEPFWVSDNDDLVEDLIENLTDYQWKVAFIREQITNLDIKPKGRTRAALVRQLIEGFVDPNRFRRQLDSLSEQDQRFYTYRLLYANLVGLRTQPTALGRIATFHRGSDVLTRRIVDEGLGLQGEDGEFFIPFTAFSLMPPRYITFETEPEPASYTGAAAPQLLLTQIQQLLSLIQNQQFTLRKRPYWQTPDYGYGRSYQIWPPVPKAVKRIHGGGHVQGRIDLCPPLPYLSDDALASWSNTLGIPPDAVEFIYSILTASDIVPPGSPVTVNAALVQAWLMKTPGSQIVTLYHLYRNVNNWAAWWPRWRDGRINVGWNYQNWWLLSSMNQAIETTHAMIRWVILDVLSYLPHDAWLSVDKVAAFLGQLFPSPSTHYYLQHDLLLKDRHNWKGFLREVLLAIIQGPLHLLGFADVAPDTSETTLFRLHHFQDVHWNRVTDVPTGETQRLEADDVIFLEDANILHVTPPAPAEFLIAVQRWAEPRGLANNKLRYQLDVGRLHDAFERGETPETLTAAWETTAAFPPPATIARWWQTWWNRYGHVRLYTGQSTVMTRDDFTMHELQVALPALRDAILGLVTPRTALVETEHVDQILSDLERQGYMPKEMP